MTFAPPNRPFASPRPASIIASALTFICASLLAAPTLAADVTVQISKRGSGQPLRGVSVCLGTGASPTQFGAWRADRDGVARFRDVPKSELMLTVSGQGLRGYRQRFNVSTANRSLVVVMPAGGGGPSCEASRDQVVTQRRSSTAADTTITARGLAIGIERFSINGGERTTSDPAVTLDLSLAGAVTHYRASENPEFEAAEWQPIATNAPFELSDSPGRKKIYVQVRKYLAMNGGEIQRLSKIASDTIVLEDGVKPET